MYPLFGPADQKGQVKFLYPIAEETVSLYRVSLLVKGIPVDVCLRQIVLKLHGKHNALK